MVFCAVCFGDPASPLTQGYNYAVISLLAVVVLVLGSFAALFFKIYKKSKSFQK